MMINNCDTTGGWQAGMYNPMFTEHKDRVYISKVFSFSPDYQWNIDADEVLMGGSGYCIHLKDGKEWYYKELDWELPSEIEHIYPDYSIYGITDCAYGFLSRGCPRQCEFCHVAAKEGCTSHQVADLDEFWSGQKNITLCDPNILACSNWENLAKQLIDSKAYVDFNQGLDIRLMTKERAELVSRIKTKSLHFAWDRYEDKDMILPKFEMFKKISGKNERSLIVYVLCGYNTTMEQDLERIYTLRKMGYWAYVMLYNKDNIPKGHPLRKLQRWVNNRFIFAKCQTFDEYQKL